ncbi:tyrosine-type recombinase/integrase [Rhizobium anhuiense]|uniref:tyrosine-type recombinase/integrase n=1 Tax=Rhizobium anhuiense TaxID=1184720 RepID=UPI0015CF6BC2|nr:site-specific integrase [Rhizobium anhuiense]
MLFDTETGEPITLFNLFLKATTAGRAIARWKETQKSYADDLANWYTFLKFRGMAVDNPSRSNLEEYAGNLVQEISSDTGQEFADSTQRRRLGTVITAYKWATNEGYLASNPFENISNVVYGGNEDRDDISDLMPGKPRPGEHVSVVPLKPLRIIFKQLGPVIEERQPYGPSIRDRLAAEIGFASALRVDEIANIDVHQILALERLIDPDDPKQLLELRLNKTKGRASRVVPLAQRLLKKFLHYIRGERAEVCRRVVELFGFTRTPSNMLFLNLVTANKRDLGRAASKDTLSRAFTSAAKATGHIKRENRALLGPDGVPLRNFDGSLLLGFHIVAANTFHDLRHTYVVVGYRVLKKKGVKNPWKELSLVLGHATMKTTIDTYGRHVEIDEADISDILDEMLYDRDTWAEAL